MDTPINPPKYEEFSVESANYLTEHQDDVVIA